MSNVASTWAWNQQTSSPACKIVLLAMADHANNSGECLLSIRSYADACNLSKPTIRKALKKLEQQGLIITHPDYAKLNLPHKT
jgi:DNA-binding transcriptional regulator YhcF (GntR family)